MQYNSSLKVLSFLNKNRRVLPATPKILVSAIPTHTGIPSLALQIRHSLHPIRCSSLAPGPSKLSFARTYTRSLSRPLSLLYPSCTLSPLSPPYYSTIAYTQSYPTTIDRGLCLTTRLALRYLSSFLPPVSPSSIVYLLAPPHRI